MSLAEFMAEALNNKNFGYYATRILWLPRGLHNSAGDLSDLWRIDRTMDLKCLSTTTNRRARLSC